MVCVLSGQAKYLQILVTWVFVWQEHPSVSAEASHWRSSLNTPEAFLYHQIFARLMEHNDFSVNEFHAEYALLLQLNTVGVMG